MSENFNACSNQNIKEIDTKINSQIDFDKYTLALIEADRYLAKCPNANKIIVSKSRALIAKKEYTLAISLLQNILKGKNSSESEWAKYYLAIALYKSGDCSSAIKIFKELEDSEISQKVKIAYYIGYCFYTFNDWSASIQKLEYVVINKDALVDSKGNNSTYQTSLFYLADIYANLWYQHRNNFQRSNYRDKFLKYYRAYFDSKQEQGIAEVKVLLDRINTDIKSNSQQNEVYAYIYRTQEFKTTICKLYSEIGQEIPANLSGACIR